MLIIIGHLPQQQVAGVARSDSFKCVQLKLVEVVIGVLRTNVGSEQNMQQTITEDSTRVFRAFPGRDVVWVVDSVSPKPAYIVQPKWFRDSYLILSSEL